jgi:hypothetical protein
LTGYILDDKKPNGSSGSKSYLMLFKSCGYTSQHVLKCSFIVTFLVLVEHHDPKFGFVFAGCFDDEMSMVINDTSHVGAVLRIVKVPSISILLTYDSTIQ